MKLRAQLDNFDSDEFSLVCEPGSSMTHQSFAEECDINTIVRRFGVSGELPSGVRMPSYGDFSGVRDFHTAMNAIALANESFDAMPADVRARFHHDPQEFLEFCGDDQNRPEALKLGLVVAQAAELAKGGSKVVPVASSDTVGAGSPAGVPAVAQ